MAAMKYNIVFSPDQGLPPCQAALHLEYEASGFYQDRWIALDAERPSFQWIVDAPEGDAGTALYSGALLYTPGCAVPIPQNPLGASTTVSPSAIPTTVTVVPIDLAFTELAS